MADYRNDGRIKPQCHSPSDTTYCRGLFFLLFGQYKVFGTHFTIHGRFEKWIQSFIIEGAYPWMKPILEEIILPHARICAFLTAYGELMIGGPHTPCFVLHGHGDSEIVLNHTHALSRRADRFERIGERQQIVSVAAIYAAPAKMVGQRWSNSFASSIP